MASDEQKPAKPSVSDSFLWPRPVDPEEARRKQPAVDVDRSVVELTSPIGHRLRVPQTGNESVVSALPPAGEPPKPKKKKKRR
jgi:hypothetical protein